MKISEEGCNILAKLICENETLCNYKTKNELEILFYRKVKFKEKPNQSALEFTKYCLKNSTQLDVILSEISNATNFENDSKISAKKFVEKINKILKGDNYKLIPNGKNSYIVKLSNNTESLYSNWEPRARKFKIVIQMCIGVGITLLILAELISLTSFDIVGGLPVKLPKVESLIKIEILKMVSLGLGAATGIELAYMLFTEGPDEAIDPLIMGIAAFVLAQLSKSTLEGGSIIGIALLVILIPILFYTKNKFF